MSRVCPNCKYARKPGDSAPDWQCPACEMAYNKGAGADVPETYGRYGVAPPARPAAGFSAGRWLLVLVVVGLAVWLGRPFWQANTGTLNRPAAQQAGQPEVTLYATDWCGYCAATRELFAANGIRYTELNIENSRAGQEGYRQLGGNGVPLIVIDQEVIHGYNEARLRALLKPWFRRG